MTKEEFDNLGPGDRIQNKCGEVIYTLSKGWVGKYLSLETGGGTFLVKVDPSSCQWENWNLVSKGEEG